MIKNFEYQEVVERSSLRLDKMYGDFYKNKLTKSSNDFFIVTLKRLSKIIYNHNQEV